MSRTPEMAGGRSNKGFPRVVAALKRREEPAHGDFVAVMKDTVGASKVALQAVQEANKAAMVALVTREAAREGRDLEKWLFNADTMRWQTRVVGASTQKREG